ncbi:MAG TPA: rhodanese-like domain-containing protein [Gammaproteobacteria bacterium]|jgi:rhodanese-related sulfurtransferase|nr:rhodanese-like domain-containing protein [Gammaproteobacteria bacterium]
MTELQHLTPADAYQLLQDDPRAVLVDIRSTMEHLFVGHPKGAVHIPWVDEPEWTVNPHFVTRVRELMLGGVIDGGNGAAPVILICRSGKRTMDAGQLLVENGFSNVFNVLEGFEGDLDHDHHRSSLGGWRFHGLPWEQC